MDHGEPTVNAAKHTQTGTTIWVSVQRQRGGVLLLVEDEGPGVPAALQEQVFQPSTRAATSPTTHPARVSA